MIASDFTDNSLTGITTVIGGFASIIKTITNDISLEGPESFFVNIRFGSPSGPIVGTSPIISVADTSVPTYQIVPSTLSINEEQTITFTINTTGVPDNTTLYYNILGSSGLVATDFFDNALNGSFVINSNTGTITKTLFLDFTTEGNETFYLILRRGNVTTGTIVATSPTITIVDTSISPYEFTSFNFTNAGATGRTGPTLAQCLSSYDTTTYPWLTYPSFFNMVSQGKQLWTVKIGGVYEFDVRGARGGSYTPSNFVGGYGARIVSRVTLSPGQVIAIAVGQMGRDSTSYPTSGGGSFVVLDSSSTPLVVAGGGAAAGGGGGGNSLSNAQGQITTFGASSPSRGGGSGTNGGGGGGGRNMSGGNAADGASNGSYTEASGGAGFYGSGGEALNAVNSRGLKWSLGMLGGFSSVADATLVGGFGGGAGMAPGLGAPGAGGYSGGGGAYYNYYGQGGGSFTTSSFSGTNITATQGFNSGHGSVSVTLISVTESYNTFPSTQNVNEGSILRFITNTVGVPNTTLYYTISGSAGISSSDFTDNTLTGSFNIVSGVGTVTKTLSNDLSFGEGTETLYMNVSTGSPLGPVVSTSPIVNVYDTSTATGSITPSVSFLNEGDSVGFTVTTTNIPDNTTLYYTISGSSGISTSDFVDGTLNGSFNIISGTATITKTISNDFSSNEGTETFNMSIRSGSFSGNIGTTSSNITVYDTSISPYTVSPSTLNVNEGGSVIFTTSATGISDRTLYYTISGTGINVSDFSSPLSGPFPFVSGTGSITLTLSNDVTTEGTETFYVNVSTGSTTGPIVGISSFVTINDTSKTALHTNIQGLASYMSGFLSEYKNPSFYDYALDSSPDAINDGSGDMYDGGNFTSPWLISGSTSNILYSNTTATTVDTDFKYASVSGYTTRPLTAIGTRIGTGNPIGWQKTGNLGADGSGSLYSGYAYNGSTVNGFTVYSYIRQAYNAGDPSVCDLYILLGHPSWDSTFGTINAFSANSTDNNNGYLYTSGAGVKNVLSIVTLLSKSSGVRVTDDECRTVTDNMINRIKLYYGL